MDTIGEVRDRLSSTNRISESLELENGTGQEQSHEDEDWGETSTFDSPPKGARSVFDQDKRNSCTKELARPGEIHNGSLKIVQLNKENQVQFHPTSFELLRSYGKGLKRMRGQKIIDPTNVRPSVKVKSEGLSTEEILRIAGKRFIETSAEPVSITCLHNYHIDVSFSGFSEEDARKVTMVEFLLKSANEVANQQYGKASILLDECGGLSSFTGNAVQRIVYYFSEALRERVKRETGRLTSQDLEKLMSFSIDEKFRAPTPATLAYHQAIPFSQVVQFGGIQTIVENVAQAKKIHLIGLEIKLGSHLTCLMQALASRSEPPIELFKVTAIGTTKKLLIEETGKRLQEFSQAIHLPFCFKIVMVHSILDLKQDLFEIDDDEKVVVCSNYFMRKLITQPDELNYVMEVIRNLNPCIMAVIESELQIIAPSFIDFFIEMLLYFSAYYDCFEVCMDDEPSRIVIESSHFGETIRNLITTDRTETKNGSAELAFWRRLFVGFGFEEDELSSSTLCQANLVAKTFSGGNFCTFAMDRKSLLIGWKGIPLHSLSAWKFNSQK